MFNLTDSTCAQMMYIIILIDHEPMGLRGRDLSSDVCPTFSIFLPQFSFQLKIIRISIYIRRSLV